MRKPPLIDLLLILLSSALLFLSFPNNFSPWGFSALVWIALIPLLYVLERNPSGKRILWAGLWGLAGYGSIIHWMVHVHWGGFLSLLVLLVSQPLIFSLFYNGRLLRLTDTLCRLARSPAQTVLASPARHESCTCVPGRTQENPQGFQANRHFASQTRKSYNEKSSGLVFICYCSALWVFSEWVRTYLMGGFSWTLGLTQSFHPIWIQTAQLTGSYGISFFIVFINACLYRATRDPQNGRRYFMVRRATLVGSTHSVRSPSRASETSRGAHHWNAGGVEPPRASGASRGVTTKGSAEHHGLKSVVECWFASKFERRSKKKINKGPRVSTRVDLVLAILVLVLLGAYGIFMQKKEAKDATGEAPYKVCVVQPNIDSKEKLDPQRAADIVDKYIILSERCGRKGRPAPHFIDQAGGTDLIVWPETAVTRDFSKDEAIYSRIGEMIKALPAYYLIGSALWIDGKDYNSAVMLDPHGELVDVYNKRELIPFAEYFPSFPPLGFLKSSLYKKNYEFHPGQRPGIFPIVDHKGNLRGKFGVSICSEDGYPAVFSTLKRMGSRFVCVILNDGWFKSEAALMMHAQSSVMRAVEFGLPIVRAGNTGFSCSIDRSGRLLPGILSLNKEEVQTFQIDAGRKETFYGQFGDIFAACCGLFVIIMSIAGYVRKFPTVNHEK